MILNKISDTVFFNAIPDSTAFKNEIFSRLISQFQGIGLKGSINGDSIEFEKQLSKRDDFGRVWRLKNLFSVIRFARAEIISKHDQGKEVQVSVDLTYLFSISIVFGICFCLGFALYISEIGLLVYLTTAFSIMTLTLTVGCVYIWTELAEIIKQLQKLSTSLETEQSKR